MPPARSHRSNRAFFKPGPDKSAKDTLALDVSLKKVQPGGYSLAIQQYGKSNRDKVPLTAYSSDIQLDDIRIHSGDNATVLTGSGLKDVVSVEINKQTFTPLGEGSEDKTIHLHANAGVSPDNGSDAIVTLKDGRTMTINVVAEAARLGLNLLSFKAPPAQKDGDIPIVLGAKDDISLEATLTFVVQTKMSSPGHKPLKLPRSTAQSTLSSRSPRILCSCRTTILQELS